MGADSYHVSTDLTVGDSWGRTEEKLFPLGERLVWGWYGDTGGSELEDRIADIAFDGWPDLVGKIGNLITELKHGGTLGVLVGGFIKGDGEIHHIGDGRNSLRSVTAVSDAMFCGYCKMAALTGWESASSVDDTTDIERRFDAVMESVIRVSNGVLKEPRVLWRVTAELRTQVRSTAPSV